METVSELRHNKQCEPAANKSEPWQLRNNGLHLTFPCCCSQHHSVWRAVRAGGCRKEHRCSNTKHGAKPIATTSNHVSEFGLSHLAVWVVVIREEKQGNASCCQDEEEEEEEDEKARWINKTQTRCRRLTVVELISCCYRDVFLLKSRPDAMWQTDGALSHESHRHLFLAQQRLSMKV